MGIDSFTNIMSLMLTVLSLGMMIVVLIVDKKNGR